MNEFTTWFLMLLRQLRLLLIFLTFPSFATSFKNTVHQTSYWLHLKQTLLVRLSRVNPSCKWTPNPPIFAAIRSPFCSLSNGVFRLRRLSRRDRIPCLPAWPSFAWRVGSLTPQKCKEWYCSNPATYQMNPEKSRKIHGISYTSQRPGDKLSTQTTYDLFPGESLKITAHFGLIFQQWAPVSAIQHQ